MHQTAALNQPNSSGCTEKGWMSPQPPQYACGTFMFLENFTNSQAFAAKYVLTVLVYAQLTCKIFCHCSLFFQSGLFSLSFHFIHSVFCKWLFSKGHTQPRGYPRKNRIFWLGFQSFAGCILTQRRTNYEPFRGTNWLNYKSLGYGRKTMENSGRACEFCTQVQNRNGTCKLGGLRTPFFSLSWKKTASQV